VEMLAAKTDKAAAALLRKKGWYHDSTFKYMTDLVRALKEALEE